MKALVLGLGNPILGDDGIGWRVVQEVQSRWSLMPSPPSFPDSGSEGGEGFSIEFDLFAQGGMALMERLIGYHRVILVDALVVAEAQPGRLHRLSLDDIPSLHANAAHDASLKTALALGRQLGADLPKDILIFAIEIRPQWDFSEELSPAVEAAVPEAVKAVLDALMG